MDQIWLASPSPAMRLWPGAGGATWRLNPAALAWGRRRKLNESSWRGVAAALSEALTGSREREGRLSSLQARWRSLPMSTGWLVWLQPDPLPVDPPLQTSSPHLLPDDAPTSTSETDFDGSFQADDRDPSSAGLSAARNPPDAAERATHDRAAPEHPGATRSEFLARLSHELRTPLNAVLGFAQLIEHDGTSVPVSVQLDRVVRIREAGEQLLRLIGDVLDHLQHDPSTDELSDTIPAALDDAAAVAGDRGELSVLYIEDNPVNVLLVEELVAMRPRTRLRCAVNGLSGVALATAGAPDVVLVDMQLPDIDGFEVLRRLRANPALDRSSIIALSANGMGEDIALALAAGFDDYWTKPIDFRQFLRGLDALARSR